MLGAKANSPKSKRSFKPMPLKHLWPPRTQRRRKPPRKRKLASHSNRQELRASRKRRLSRSAKQLQRKIKRDARRVNGERPYHQPEEKVRINERQSYTKIA